MNVAITGAAGFLGSAIAASAARRGHTVIGIDTRRAEGVIVADIHDTADLSAIFAEKSVTRVVHAAAIVGVAGVSADLVAATRVNVVGAVSVFTAAERSGVTRVVDLSSEEIYGAASGEVLREDADLFPVSAYGSHKLSSELLSREFSSFEYAAARLSWIFGRGFPRQRPPQPWLDAARAGAPSPDAPGGDHRADLLHVDDAVSAVLALVEADTLAHRAYNVGSGEAVSLQAVASLIHRIEPTWDVRLSRGPLPGVAERPPLSIERIRAELGWMPDLSLEEGLRRTLHGR